MRSSVYNVCNRRPSKVLFFSPPLLNAFSRLQFCSHFCMKFAQTFKPFVNFTLVWNVTKHWDIFLQLRVIPLWWVFMSFGFQTKLFKSVKGWWLNHMTLNAAVVRSFLGGGFNCLRLSVGVKHRYSKRSHLLAIVRHSTSLVISW